MDGNFARKFTKPGFKVTSWRAGDFFGGHLLGIFATQVCFKVRYLQKWINWWKSTKEWYDIKAPSILVLLKDWTRLNGWRCCFGSINGSSCLGRTSSNFRSIRPYVIEAWKVVFFVHLRKLTARFRIMCLGWPSPNVRSWLDPGTYIPMRVFVSLTLDIWISFIFMTISWHMTISGEL